MSTQIVDNNKYLDLHFTGTSLKLTQLTHYQRIVFSGLSHQYISFGGEMPRLVKKYPIPNAKNRWTISAVIDQKTRKQFLEIVRSNFKNEFELSDTCLSVIEPTISRLKAIDFMSVKANGDIEYFAKFLVAIDLSSIKEQPLGDWVQLSFIMNELEKLTA